jgi:hypothetical protein
MESSSYRNGWSYIKDKKNERGGREKEGGCKGGGGSSFSSHGHIQMKGHAKTK